MLASTVAAATAYTNAPKAMLLLDLFPAMASIDVSTPYPLFVSLPPFLPPAMQPSCPYPQTPFTPLPPASSLPS